MPARIRWLAAYPLLHCLIFTESFAVEPKPTMRPISNAESVVAVYREDWGLASRGEPALIFAAWPDGLVIWSRDRLNGGAPYRAGHIESKLVTSLLARFEEDGLFEEKKLNDVNFGPDSEFITLFIKSGKKRLKMCSWHELVEADGVVADQAGLSRLEGRRRLEALRKSPADYLFYRFVWSETRTKLAQLVPDESIETVGEPVMKAGDLSWQVPATAPAGKGS